MSVAQCKAGDELVITFSTRDHDNAASDPDNPPVASFYQGGSRVAVVPSVIVQGERTDVYMIRAFIGNSFSVGKLIVVIRWGAGGDDCRLHVSAEVLPGGDSEGPIISMYAFNRPDGRYVVAQCAGGRLFRGKNPRLSL